MQEIYGLLIKESGGPYTSSSQSTDPRNKRQLYNVNLKRRRESESNDTVGIVPYIIFVTWVIDSCYRNKSLIGNDSGHHPVILGPVLFHFAKDDQTSPGLLWNYKLAIPRREN